MCRKRKGALPVYSKQLNSRVEGDEQVEGDGMCVVLTPQEVCISD